ncbi:unnamed protein product, partial [Sphacelaria rigidula]
VDHRLVDANQAVWWTQQLKEYCDERHILFDELDAVHKRFVRNGRLTKAYVGFLWREEYSLVHTHVFARMLSTLAIHGAMFRCTVVNDNHCGDAGSVVADGDEELMVPTRLPARVSDASLLQLETAIFNGVRMQFTVNIYSNYVPAGLVAQFLGMLHDSASRIILRSCWNRGAAFIIGGLEYLVCLHDPTDALPCRIELDIAGSTPKTVNGPGCRVKDALLELLAKRYPGLQFKASREPQLMFGEQAWQDSMINLQGHLERRICE